MAKRISAVMLFCLIQVNIALAAHPLIADDTGTQGKGKMQFELIGEYGRDSEEGVIEKGYEVPTIPVFSYGINDDIDIVFGLPYVAVRSESIATEDLDGEEITYNRIDGARGVGDASIEVKARLYEKDGLSLAVKPGISLPTGNENKGLGSGNVSYSAFLIASKEAEPWAVHFNVGYALNDYKLTADKESNRKHLWHVSAASQVAIAKNLALVANIGMERNSDKASHASPAFALGGFIYSITENLDVDMGVKVGLNRHETDLTYLAGIVWRL